MSYCKFCGQEIDWIASLEGKPVPVNPDPVFVIEGGGVDTFLDDTGATIIGRRAREYEERRDLPVAFAPHRRTCAAYDPRVKQHGRKATAQTAEGWRQEFEAAMAQVQQAAKALGADAEEMEREANLLATSTTMDYTTALYHVAGRRLNEANKNGGGDY
uniref:Uncharacterized protein n=1 Tax=Dulem virus 34 TaxID=3145752 RepID=A0AAU8B509_9CAUD